MTTKLIKPMLPSLVNALPEGENWLYEIKYDGFRTILHWHHSDIILQSRNLNHLNEQFPEVVEGIKELADCYNTYFPIVLDGELCILTSNYKADFAAIQQRGRLRSKDKIAEASKNQQAIFVVFDILHLQNKNMMTIPYHKRKDTLFTLLKKAAITTGFIQPYVQSIIGAPVFSDPHEIWGIVENATSEGVVAKKKESVWKSGRTTDWLKIKNLKRGLFLITGYDTKNGYFQVAVIKNDIIFPLGVFSHGLEGNERDAIVAIIKKNILTVTNDVITVQPRICVELEYLELYKEQLRHPRFIQFRFDISWEDCTWEALQKNREN